MEYVPVAIAFALALVALLGNTSDKNGRGLKKLTGLGWFTAALIVASFVYSLYAVYAQRKSLSEKRAGAHLVADIIHDEVQNSLHDLLSPFRQMYIENTGGKYVPEKSITITKLLASTVVNSAIHTCLDSKPKTFFTIPDSGTWNDIFHTGIKSGIYTLNNVVAQYGGYANPQLLSAIHQLEANGDLSSYAHWTPPTPGTLDPKNSIPRCFVGWPIGAYKQYLTMLQELQNANEAGNGAR